MEAWEVVRFLDLSLPLRREQLFVDQIRTCGGVDGDDFDLLVLSVDANRSMDEVRFFF